MTLDDALANEYRRGIATLETGEMLGGLEDYASGKLARRARIERFAWGAEVAVGCPSTVRSFVYRSDGRNNVDRTSYRRNAMPHPVIHAEIRSEDPDATRKFFSDLLVGRSPRRAGSPAIRSSTPARLTARRWRQSSPGAEDEVLFFVAVEDCRRHAEEGRGTGWQDHPARPTGARRELRRVRRRSGHKVGVAAN